MKFLKTTLFLVIFTILLAACNSREDTVQEPIEGEATFIGSGEFWDAIYLHTSEQTTSWMEISYKGNLQGDFNLSKIDIEIIGRTSRSIGNLGDMVTEVVDNKIRFLVGIINNEMYINDEFELTINHKENQDKIIYKIKE